MTPSAPVHPLLEAGRALILIPARNEEEAIGAVVDEVYSLFGKIPVLVIDDGSHDSTAAIVKGRGARVLRLPHHLGLGGALQAGYRLAFELGFEYVVRIDGDGQHDPRFIPAMIDAVAQPGVQMAIGSRFVGSDDGYTSFLRGLGIRLFRAFLRPILGKPVRDPTSGFVAVNREALEVFSRSFPLEYPEIEALVVLRRRAFHFVEVPVSIRPRRAGRSTITALKSVYYLVHVMLGVLVNILIFDRRRWR
ncbi:MAG: glycosyltransferase family 2 protein [Bryobacterales bacterium]|nr:glycosyltransferase family 2 protein [Bryobacterales bacterium]